MVAKCIIAKAGGGPPGDRVYSGPHCLSTRSEHR
jgi:hypothetical protein